MRCHNRDLLEIEEGGDLILMMVVIAMVLVMSMTTSNIDKELQNSLNILSFCYKCWKEKEVLVIPHNTGNPGQQPKQIGTSGRGRWTHTFKDLFVENKFSCYRKLNIAPSV